MDNARQAEIIQALNAKGVRLPCPRCGSGGFTVAGESFISLQNNPSTFVVGGPVIPTVLVVCQNCGYVTQHAQIPLGIVKKVDSDAN